MCDCSMGVILWAIFADERAHWSRVSRGSSTATGAGRITCADACLNSIAPVPRSHPAYQYMDDRDNDVVARSEAHDSGLCAADSNTRRTFGRDLINLTLASPSVNRHQKVAKDLAQWLPALNRCWYVNQVVLVKRKYNLTMDQAEYSTAQRVLAGCARPIVMQFTDQGAAPAPPPAAAPPPASSGSGGNCDSDPLGCYDDNNNGRITCAEARAHGIAPVPRGHPAYQYMRDGDSDGVVCE